MSASAYPNIYNGTLLDEIIHEQKLSADLVKRAAREIFNIIKEGLMRDGVVRINHFGSFKLKRVAARKGHNPRTGETITIPARAKVMFTPCKALREMIEPVHKKPIPIASTKIKSVPTVAPQKEKPTPPPVALVTPTAESAPALLKTDDRTSTAVEQINDIEEALSETPHKRGRTEKLIYIGIAATIIAMVAIKVCRVNQRHLSSR